MFKLFSKLFVVVVLLSMLCVYSCGEDITDIENPEGNPIDTYNLTINGSGFDDHNNASVTAILYTKHDMGVVGLPMAAKITNGAFSLNWNAVITPGVKMQVNYFIDKDGNYICGSGEAYTLEVVSDTHKVVNVTATNAQAGDVCAAFGPFDLNFSGLGFDMLAGKKMRVVVMTPLGRLLRTSWSAIDSSGSFLYNWSGAVSLGFPHTIFYAVDANDDGVCSTIFPDDSYDWLVSTLPATGDVNVAESFDPSKVTPVNVCAYMNDFGLAVLGDNFIDESSAYAGKTATMAVVLVRGEGQNQKIWYVAYEQKPIQQINSMMTMQVADGFEFIWPYLLQDGDRYEVYYYVDMNGDRKCSDVDADAAYQKDRAWKIVIESADAGNSFTVSPSDALDPTACAVF